jgi:hypothetical protein
MKALKLKKVSKELGNFWNKIIKKIVMLAITHCQHLMCLVVNCNTGIPYIIVWALKHFCESELSKFDARLNTKKIS